MKKYGIVLLMIICILFWGCDKETIYTITSSSTSGGTIIPYGKTLVVPGDSITYKINATEAHAIKSIKVDDVVQPISEVYKFENVMSNHEINVEFISTYTIVASASEGGTINPDGVITVESGASKTFTFLPDANYNIYSIKVNGVEQPITDKFEFKNVSKNSDIEVKFVHNNYLLIINHKWYLQKSEIKYVKDSVWEELTPEPRAFTDYYVFKTDGFNYVYDKDNKMIGGPYEWSCSNKGLKITTYNYAIELLDKNKMVLVITIPSALPGIPSVDKRRTYVHS